MPKKSERTPRSRIVSHMRILWLRSRERAKALKDEGYQCEDCKRKQSTKKGNVIKMEGHHPKPINWDKIVKVIQQELLIPPSKIQCLCHDCHKKYTNEQRRNRT